MQLHSQPLFKTQSLAPFKQPNKAHGAEKLPPKNHSNSLTTHYDGAWCTRGWGGEDQDRTVTWHLIHTGWYTTEGGRVIAARLLCII